MNLVKKLIYLMTLLLAIVGCNDSILLPYDLEFTVNSSYLRIEDHDGWGVLSEGASIPDRKDVEVSSLLRYLVASNGLYVEIRTNKDKTLYVVVTPKDETNLGFNYDIMNGQDFEKWENASIDNLQWKNFR